ncbi:hypothetical protein ABG067_000649 [Albugo candida]
MNPGNKLSSVYDALALECMQYGEDALEKVERSLEALFAMAIRFNQTPFLVTARRNAWNGTRPRMGNEVLSKLPPATNA